MRQGNLFHSMDINTQPYCFCLDWSWDYNASTWACDRYTGYSYSCSDAKAAYPGDWNFTSVMANLYGADKVAGLEAVYPLEKYAAVGWPVLCRLPMGVSQWRW